MMRKFILFVFVLFVCSVGFAESDGELPGWSKAGLLDSDTRSRLVSFEAFFNETFTLSAKYDPTSESSKKDMVRRWVRNLDSRNRNTSTLAGASLGMVKAKSATGTLEKKLIAGASGRLRWVCTRSLGQIGSKSSIDVLVGLLDNVNTNTRIYARASLAEITGVYYGGDKEKWKAWQRGESPDPCGSSECDPETASTQRRANSRTRLDFQMTDIYGRMVDSQDYAGSPVLIMCGGCWCGGCQADCEPFRKFAKEHAAMGLRAIRCVAGDNELAAMDFQKHYRLDFVQLLDTDRSFEKRYNETGKWTFMMLADGNGKIVSKINRPEEKDWQALRKILSSMPAKRSEKMILRDSINYMPATLKCSGELEKQKVWEILPSIACGADGKIYVVFTTNRNGTSDVMLRVYDGVKWSDDAAVAATETDEYDGRVVVDKNGKAWVCWVSKVKGGNYDIFMAEVTGSGRFAPVRVTTSDDDAMNPRMACDDKGRVWITYYKWRKMKMVSRDKEVYVRRMDRGTLSREIQVSPTDVPEYEDHSEPFIEAYGSGAIVGWSWDFHAPNKGYSSQGKTPTVFFRPISGSMKMGKIACVSGQNVDVTPSLAIGRDKKIWFAWDSLSRNQRKSICVANPSIGSDYPVSKILPLNKPVKNVCSPGFATGPAGELALVWSETINGRDWTLKRSDLNPENRWTIPAGVKLQGNPRFSSAAYDDQGNVWAAYSAAAKEGSEVLVKKLGKNSQLATVKLVGNSKVATKVKNGSESDNSRAIQKLRQAIDTRYSYRDFRGVDWDKAFGRYERYMLRAKTSGDFARSAAAMLDQAKDAHIWVKANGVPVRGKFKRVFRPNYDLNIIKRSVPGYRDVSRYVSTGQYRNGIGYILIKSWTKNEDEVLKPALKALKSMSGNRALIIDVRPNGGGTESFAQAFAGCFIDKSVVYAKHAYKNVNKPGGWDTTQERKLRPNSEGFRYKGKVVVLMGQENMSSCDAFLLMMKQVPGCKLIGDKSYGSSGNPKEHNLGNGVSVWMPSWKAMRADGTCFEGEGIMPDVRVKNSSRAGRDDRILKAALTMVSER